MERLFQYLNAGFERLIVGEQVLRVPRHEDDGSSGRVAFSAVANSRPLISGMTTLVNTNAMGWSSWAPIASASPGEAATSMWYP